MKTLILPKTLLVLKPAAQITRQHKFNPLEQCIRCLNFTKQKDFFLKK